MRVIYTNECHQLLPGKFGNHFETRVANHSEILLFKRNVVKNAKGPAATYDIHFEYRHLDINLIFV